MIDDILRFNDYFVRAKAYEPFVTDKFPSKHVAVLTCMDTRLTELLPKALGLKNGDAKIIKNAGALVPAPWDSAMRSLLVAVYELGVTEIMVVAHSGCGACHMGFAHFRGEMLQRGVTEETLAGIEAGGVDLTQWLEGFHHPEQSVLDTVANIKNHPLMPQDVTVRGFIMDSATGALTEIL